MTGQDLAHSLAGVEEESLGVINQVPFAGGKQGCTRDWGGFGVSPWDPAAAQWEAQAGMLCTACMCGVNQCNGTGKGLWSLGIMSGLWAGELGPSGTVAGGPSTTKDSAICLDADTQTQGVVLDLV